MGQPEAEEGSGLYLDHLLNEAQCRHEGVYGGMALHSSLTQSFMPLQWQPWLEASSVGRGVGS